MSDSTTSSAPTAHLASVCAPAAHHRWRWVVATLAVVVSSTYFAAGLWAREASLLESQDLAIACELLRDYSLSPDHSPLHFIFLHFWARLNDTSFAFLRLPSVLFCALAVPIVFSVAKREAGTSAGVLAALLFASNPLVVDNARSTRMYSLVVLLAAGCLWFAQAYLRGSKSRRSLVGFATCSVLGIYTHLFMWVLVGSLALLLLIDLIRTRRDHAQRGPVVKVGSMALVLLIPQVVHIATAIRFTEGRHAIYRGIAGDTLGFMLPVLQTLFLGEARTPPLPLFWLILPVALVGLGIWGLGRRGITTAAAIFLPSCLIAWILSRSNPVLPRYLNYLEPAITVFMGVGLARLPRRAVSVPLAVAMVALSVQATRRVYAGPPADWAAASTYVESIRKSDDVVAVFPDHWAWTFRRYSPLRDVASFTLPAELDRILSRGRRVILLRNHGRDFANVEAFLTSRARYREAFRTRNRNTLNVYVVEPRRERRLRRSRWRRPAVLFFGVVGSGGYDWQQKPQRSDPFGRLRELIRWSSVAVAGYAAYDPPWPARLLLDSEQVRPLLPNAEVTREMQRVGLTHVVVTSAGGDRQHTQEVLDAGGLHTLPALGPSSTVEPTTVDVGGVKVGLLNLASGEARGGRADDDTADAQRSLALRSVVESRKSLGHDARIVVVFPRSPDYARLPLPREKRVMREIIDRGADAVVGMGGLASNEIEQYRGGVIAYSLGTLLRPRSAAYAVLDSSGLAVWLTFPPDRRIACQVLPVTFDDESRPALGSEKRIRHLVDPDRGARRSLLPSLRGAQVTLQSSSGTQRELRGWVEGRDASSLPYPTWMVDALGPTSEWIQGYQIPAVWIPFSEGYVAGSAKAVLTGLFSMGEFRRVLELDPGSHRSVSARFAGVKIENAMTATYGVGDDRIRRKFRVPGPQRLKLAIGDQTVLDVAVPYLARWQTAQVDTHLFAQTTQDVTVTLETDGAHFPVGIDVEVSRSIR